MDVDQQPLNRCERAPQRLGAARQRRLRLRLRLAQAGLQVGQLAFDAADLVHRIVQRAELGVELLQERGLLLEGALRGFESRIFDDGKGGLQRHAIGLQLHAVAAGRDGWARHLLTLFGQRLVATNDERSVELGRAAVAQVPHEAVQAALDGRPLGHRGVVASTGESVDELPTRVIEGQAQAALEIGGQPVVNDGAAGRVFADVEIGAATAAVTARDGLGGAVDAKGRPIADALLGLAQARTPGELAAHGVARHYELRRAARLRQRAQG